MSPYLSWKQIEIKNFKSEYIENYYNQGFVFGRIGKSVMDQTRSVRIDLKNFQLTSENKRILRKISDTTLQIEQLPYTNYTWHIGKMGKDFYDNKFGKDIFSANKIKDIMTNPAKSNFNRLFIYQSQSHEVGYAICFETDDILHYSYPFYELTPTNFKLNPNIGMGMMIKAIEYGMETNKKYIYLGSAQRPTDKYKLQFSGIEWFDGELWQNDLEKLKIILQSMR